MWFIYPQKLYKIWLMLYMVLNWLKIHRIFNSSVLVIKSEVIFGLPYFILNKSETLSSPKYQVVVDIFWLKLYQSWISYASHLLAVLLHSFYCSKAFFNCPDLLFHVISLNLLCILKESYYRSSSANSLYCSFN